LCFSLDKSDTFHQNDDNFILLMKKEFVAMEKTKKGQTDRITISLAPGQRDALETMAEQNCATLSYVVRYAINEFLDKQKDKQLPLTFRH